MFPLFYALCTAQCAVFIKYFNTSRVFLPWHSLVDKRYSVYSVYTHTLYSMSKHTKWEINAHYIDDIPSQNKSLLQWALSSLCFVFAIVYIYSVFVSIFQISAWTNQSYLRQISNHINAVIIFPRWLCTGCDCISFVSDPIDIFGNANETEWRTAVAIAPNASEWHDAG